MSLLILIYLIGLFKANILQLILFMQCFLYTISFIKCVRCTLLPDSTVYQMHKWFLQYSKLSPSQNLRTMKMQASLVQNADEFCNKLFV